QFCSMPISTAADRRPPKQKSSPPPRQPRCETAGHKGASDRWRAHLRLRTEFRYQGIIAYRVLEAFEPLVCASLNISCFETISTNISAPWIGDGYDPRPDFSDPSFCGQ